MLRYGDRVRTDRGLYSHVGTVDFDGRIWANSAKFGGVTKVTPWEFSEGREIHNDGQVGIYHPSQVMDRFRRIAGTPYDLVRFNCEHANNWAHGLMPKSSQIEGAIMLGLACLIVAGAVKTA